MLGFAGFVVAFILQFKARKYVAWTYSLLVVMVAVFGTMVADVTPIVFGVPDYAPSFAFAIILTFVFIAWYKAEQTLSIHSISTHRRELFYWVAVLVCLSSEKLTTLHLGYLASGILFIVLFLLPAVGYWLFGLNPIFAF